MKVRSILFLSLLLLLGAAARAAAFNIDIQSFSFMPQSQTVHTGDNVTWMNDDGVPHTATASGGEFDSGILNQGGTYSHTFNVVGTYDYFCGVHPFMTGTITVQSAAPTPPTVTIVSPANNTSYSAPTNVTIQATASPAAGKTITKVEFFDGTTSLGIDTTSPYSVTNNLAAGTHSLTAKATDSGGAVGASPTVTVTVGTGGTKITNPIPQPLAKGNITIELQTVLSGLVSPLGLAAPDDGSARLFIYDQIGLIHVVTNGVKMTVPLLDVQSRLVTLNPGYDERGLLGVATHPNFAQHPFVYTYTSEPNGPAADFPITYNNGATNNCQSVIAEWKIDANDPNKIDPASRREIMRIDKPQSNHNGGNMRFGPDGLLYFSIGDGGAADDQGDGHLPTGNAQDKTRILGKVVRIDVDGRNSANGKYGIPASNPFVSEAGSIKEIYAYGLRNPYSFSFDRQTGDLWLGDVGQNDVEEVDRIVKGGNFGWNIKEGTFYFDPNGTNNGFVTTAPVRTVPSDLIDPVAEYDHDEGEAVIGGFVYRGLNSDLTGKYVTGDWGRFESPSGRLFYLDGSELKELKIGATDRPFGNWLKGWGEDQAGNLYAFGSTNLGPAGTSGKMFKIVPTSLGASNSFVVKNLVSDLPGMAPVLDTNLVNPWGIAISATSPFWISDNHAGLSTLYDSTGGVQTLIVNIPAPAGSTGPAAPTGVIFNNTTDFLLSGTPARFIFATEDGTIVAWASGTNAILKADNSAAGAIYKGLTIANSRGTNLLYAADFHNGKIDVFDTNFQAVALGGFSDSSIPAGFAPFNIRNIGGNLYVTYAKQDANAEDDIAGPGNGYVDIFDAAGNLLRRFASQGNLNSPWGLATAPATFGAFGGALLIGNFGDGRINAFDPGTGALLGQLNDPQGNPISEPGLWDLTFGNGAKGGDATKLYFTAGIPGSGAIEDHGLFGQISYEKPFLITQLTRDGANLTLTWTGGVPPYTVQKKTLITDPTWTDVATVTTTSTTVTIEGTTGFFRVSATANP